MVFRPQPDAGLQEGVSGGEEEKGEAFVECGGIHGGQHSDKGRRPHPVKSFHECADGIQEGL